MTNPKTQIISYSLQSVALFIFTVNSFGVYLRKYVKMMAFQGPFFHFTVLTFLKSMERERYDDGKMKSFQSFLRFPHFFFLLKTRLKMDLILFIPVQFPHSAPKL